MGGLRRGHHDDAGIFSPLVAPPQTTTRTSWRQFHPIGTLSDHWLENFDGGVTIDKAPERIVVLEQDQAIEVIDLLWFSDDVIAYAQPEAVVDRPGTYWRNFFAAGEIQ